ncbi:MULTISPECIES: 2-oxo-4-hydroxy-4-carboxy-5-ureidoimidazoline decarboxylase [Halomonadaceae]|uniref:2-oxo-4-hydroxy-4-carboxy-5-ureidoimidazoline decarboxylase n=1 Tax=Modicisalibacter zincidurans TaxID=1178777 RepID=A0ABP9R0Y8_9GAMM|nr:MULTISPECIES: 2-oxo-4-hydroxy-4-carboxy-5-ureidoimidazoline decarboxylase [Halomonas]MCD6007453.1 2-oxo-4-hydroxy-4-carboxy-5-ureidoimidazoline decarboxylase [Halomonas sp. IOP_31]
MSAPLLNPRPSTLGRDAFVSHYGEVYEHSPWIAESAWDAGLDTEQDTAEGLATALAAVLDAAPAERQLAVIRAHPDLAGKAAERGELTADSSREQAGAGLDQCRPEEYARFHRYNASYQQRFGFPFVMAVTGSDRQRILAAFERRLEHTPEQERRTAIGEVNRIARLRLEARAGS